MKILAELQRRNVIRMAGLYLVGAWLVTQVAGTILPMFGAPDWLARSVVILLAIGFVPALVISWIFELTPEGLKRDADVPIAESIAPQTAQKMNRLLLMVSMLAIGYFAFDKFALAPKRDAALVVQTTQQVTQQSIAEKSKVNPNSIAVLPFVNMSGDAKNEYFSDGISEEILNVLARTPALQVAARTSSFSFKDSKQEVLEIARELKVRMMLEGSVRKQGDRVRITAQLIDASSGFHVWSQTYDRELKDIFAIQDEIAKAIGDELKVRVGGAGAGGTSVSGTKNLEAHDNYLRGLALWQVRRDDELWAAKEAFERAIAVDPNYAQPWGGLAMLYAVLPDYTVRINNAGAYSLGQQAALRALVLDPTLAEPYAALGSIERNLWHLDTAAALLKRAVELRPSFASGHQWLGTLLMLTGDLGQSIESLQRAASLDPRSVVIANNLAAVLMIAGRNADAIKACKPSLEYAPDSMLCVPPIGLAHLLDGRRDLARSYYERWAANWGVGTDRQVAELLAALEGRGDRRAFATQLSAWPSRSELDPNSGNLFSSFDTPALLVLLDERELAIQYLSQPDAVSYMIWGMLLPVHDPIRCDPGFRAVLKKHSITDARAAKLCQGKP